MLFLGVDAQLQFAGLVSSAAVESSEVIMVPDTILFQGLLTNPAVSGMLEGVLLFLQDTNNRIHRPQYKSKHKIKHECKHKRKHECKHISKHECKHKVRMNVITKASMNVFTSVATGLSIKVSTPVSVNASTTVTTMQ